MWKYMWGIKYVRGVCGVGGGAAGCVHVEVYVGIKYAPVYLRALCVLHWIQISAQPSGWCRAYIAKQQKAYL